jgi:uncharacterized DUF497 family protein
VPTVVEGDFEWDAAKARSNLTKHGVSFEEATTVFEDVRAIDAPDFHDPDRFVVIGRSRLSRVLFVVHSSERIGSVSSARQRATRDTSATEEI